MATLTVQSNPGRTGLNLTDTAVSVSSSDKFANNGSTHVHIINGNGSSLTVTIVFPAGAAVDGTSPTNKTITIASGKSYVAGPFPTGIYNDSDGYVTLNFSLTSSVKVLAYKAA